MILVLGVVNYVFVYWNSIVIKVKNLDIFKFLNLFIDCIVSSLFIFMVYFVFSRDCLIKKIINYKKCNVLMFN